MTGSIPDFQMSFCGSQSLISWLWDVDEFMALLLISVLLQIVCVFYSMITKKVMLKKYASYLLKKWFLFILQMLNEEEKEPPLLYIYTHIGRHVSIRNERLAILSAGEIIGISFSPNLSARPEMCTCRQRECNCRRPQYMLRRHSPPGRGVAALCWQIRENRTGPLLPLSSPFLASLQPPCH